jgi:hypothetical protein
MPKVWETKPVYFIHAQMKFHVGSPEESGDIVWLNLDLTYPRKAKEAAELILSRERRLDNLSTFENFRKKIA